MKRALHGRRHAFATVLLLSVMPAAAPAEGSQYLRPPDLDELWTGVEVLFVGSIDSVRSLRYVPSGSCSQGITPGRITEISLRVEELLRGAGIRTQEVIRHDALGIDDPTLTPGDRVLAFGQRTCADDWHLWAWTVSLAEGDSLKLSSELHERVKGSGDPDISWSSHWFRKDFLEPWVRKHGRRPTLRDVRESVRRLEARLPEAPFRLAEGFDLVRVEGKEVPENDVLVVRCSRLKHVAGRQGEPPTVLRFSPPPGIWRGAFPIGDTLLVPLTRGNEGSERRFDTSPEFFLVQDGYLPGLGVELEHFLERFEVHSTGFRLVPMVKPLPGRGGSGK